LKREHNWQLDALGNWQSIDSQTLGVSASPTETREHDLVNQLDSVTNTLPDPDETVAVIHDVAGNVRILPDRANPDNAMRFTYDFRNRLILVENTENYALENACWTPLAEYSYDGFNRRAKQIVEKPLTPDDETIYLYSGWRCIEERKFDENGEGTEDDAWEPRNQFTYGGQYIDDIVIFDKDTDDDGACETRHFYCANINYNVHTLTDGDGNPVERYLYDAYGRVEFLDGDGDPAARSTDNPYLFQGRRLDTETGLYYYRNRYYSPALGRFMQRDPMVYVDGMGLYGFQRNRPIFALDALGLKVELVLTSAFDAPPWFGLRHCTIVICFEDGTTETYEVSDRPNLGLTDGSVAGDDIGTIIGAIAGGSTGGTTGGSTGGTTGGATGGTTGRTTGRSTGNPSAGASREMNNGQGIAGPQFTSGDVQREVLERIVVDPTHDQDETYKDKARSTRSGPYSVTSNNCCHWARAVIEAAGGKWPISHSINWGINLGYHTRNSPAPASPVDAGSELPEPHPEFIPIGDRNVRFEEVYPNWPGM